MQHVLILAGGSGTRLWPLSHQGEPKQLLEFIDGVSLLRMAYERVAGVVPDANILVCTGASYADTVATLLPEIPAENILGEPVGRDSLNAVAWPAGLIADRDPEGVMAVVTADHIIRPVDDFRMALQYGFDLAQADPTTLVTFGVVPTEPNTGFGYLHRGAPLEPGSRAHEVLEFVEKPSIQVARQYLDSGEYWWNSGMFVWRASTLLDCLSQLKPQTRRYVDELVTDPSRLTEIYPLMEKVSVDIAVMEPASRGGCGVHVAAVPLEIQWYDVGSYEALAPHLPGDGMGNSVTGLTISIDSTGNLLINDRPDAVLAVAGLHDMAVVSTDRATLVVPLSQSQQVKALVAEVAAKAGGQYA
ncbi:mannose-1-phosphate guanylyltransferase [Cutibacterium sp. WCA-380-WT-3A]|uniref:Mannose-1-phosphate guanylyltransferase n=1 Tax=Cutibacterium porci TaxID=2605781 RepID=A0A7K0J877_9ACTN|nr:mannose-1-phosphate guanylyltransferase [Cutibacterium porci]MSS45958.1 mannose-1-phosphate guanylyltransferase [Cutibacterium porci]